MEPGSAVTDAGAVPSPKSRDPVSLSLSSSEPPTLKVAFRPSMVTVRDAVGAWFPPGALDEGGDPEGLVSGPMVVVVPPEVGLADVGVLLVALGDEELESDPPLQPASSRAAT